MPGHIGTSIVTNSRKVQTGNDPDDADAQGDRADARARRLDGPRRRRALPTRDIAQARRRARAALPRGCADHRRRRPPRSSSTASRPSAGASWSATTPKRSTAWCARPRSAPTTLDFFQTLRQGSRLEARRQAWTGNPHLSPLVSLFRERSGVMNEHYPTDAACSALEWPAALFSPHPSCRPSRATPRSPAPTRPRRRPSS